MNYFHKYINNNEKSKIFLLGFINIFASQPIGFLPILFITFSLMLYKMYQSIYEKHYEYQQFKILFIFTIGYFFGQFYWISIPLTTDIRFYWLIPIVVIFFPIGLTFCFIPGYLFLQIIFNILKKHTTYKINYLFVVILFAIVWFSGEYLRANLLFNGFPWQLLGHFITYPFAIQIIKFIDIEIFSIFFLLLILTPSIAIERYSGNLYNDIIFKKIKLHNFHFKLMSKMFIFIVLLSWFVNFIFGFIILLREPFVPVNQIIIAGSQPNNRPYNDLDEKFINSLIQSNLHNVSWVKYVNKKALIILPEAIVHHKIESKNQIAQTLSSILPSYNNNKSLLITGSVTLDNMTNKIYNTMHAINQDGFVMGFYSKQHLVPFGEYIPFRNIFPKLTNLITGNDIDFSVMEQKYKFFFYKDFPIMIPFICYEIIFSNEVKNRINLIKNQIKDKEFIQNNSMLIVNVTNDIWIGNTIGAYQHLTMSRFSAIRANTDIVRVSNNGISALIDKHGRIITQTELGKNSFLFSEY